MSNNKRNSQSLANLASISQAKNYSRKQQQHQYQHQQQSQNQQQHQQQQQHQHQHQHHQQQHELLANLANAPTSLANLAQFSGISLLPINSSARGIIQQSNGPNRIVEVPSSSTTNSSLAQRLQENVRNQQARAQVPTSLASISSIQLINETVATPLAQTRSIGTQIRNRTSKSQNQSQNRTNSARNQTNETTKANRSSGNNITQRVQGGSSLESLMTLANQCSQQQPSVFEESSTLDTQSNDLNGFTLMKLMAILNNPALTITPVNPGQLESKNRLDVETLQSPVSLHPVDPTSISRIPQSAANLQALLEATKEKDSPIAPPSTQVSGKKRQNSSNNSCNFGLRSKDSIESTMAQRLNQSNIGLFNQHLSASPSTSPVPSQTYNQNSSFYRNLSQQTLDLNFHQEKQQNQQSERKRINDNHMPTISVELLKQTVGKQGIDEDWSASEARLRSLIETECVPNLPSNMGQMPPGAKRIESKKFVSGPSKSRNKIGHKRRFETTNDRLFKPINEKSKRDTANKFLQRVFVEDGEQYEVHVSDRHYVLETMLMEGEKELVKSASEPDEIFINRPKRVMSKIDTMIERKKKRRFERISSREAPKTTSMEVQCAESEAEWSDDENTQIGSSCSFIRSQLPLEELETTDKLEHLHSVGLVTREENTKLLAEQSKRKFDLISPLAVENNFCVPENDLNKFLQTIQETNGGNSQWVVESSIKRNELPCIEGLNRYTSRMKIAFMNALGLDKRSKRTTLYRVRPLNDNLNAPLPKQSEIDSMMVKNLVSETRRLINSVSSDTMKPVTAERNSRITMQNSTNSSKINIPFCREAIKQLPDKNEYMKSLGLMAS